ncbi:hypothetical protein RGUI_1239 [Rhodovulum sp. P5]|uniref:hypothetical protein n=1 Tax=Rhodovulum sp. P5 TaxID=1564506 RepID=UPI0009C1C3C1|nr:hypothetical protein [Rhodovulum sp. P5]ARE39380.1 hypothetical protein RGUI_1239 [Rhodovulum sp. P5]
MRNRALAALLVGAMTVGGLILADHVTRRLVDFKISAETEVFAGTLQSSDATATTIYLNTVLLCHGLNLSGPDGRSGPCSSYAHGGAPITGRIQIFDGVRLRLVRRGSDAAVLQLTSTEARPTEACPGGEIGTLVEDGSTSGPTGLCAPARVVWPQDAGQAPRLVLRGVNPRIGQSIGTTSGDARPVLSSGKLEMRARGLLSETGQRLRGPDLDPLGDPVSMGKHDLSFGDTVTACSSDPECGQSPADKAPFVALVSATEARGLKVQAHVLAPALVVEGFGARAEVVKPTLFARIRKDPNVAVLYMLFGILMGFVLKVDKWIFGKEKKA